MLFGDDLDPTTREALLTVDLLTIAFGAVQIVLLPFLGEQPLLQVLVMGHVAAVVLVSGASVLLLWRGR